MQRNHGTEAAQYFGGALRSKPDYAPAILNLAIVSQTSLNNRQYALQRYQDYLSLKPRPANWEAVSATAAALEQELNAPHAAPPAPVPRAPGPTNMVPQTAPPRPASNTAARTAPPRVEQPPVVRTPAPAPAPTQPVEVTELAPEPVVHPAEDNGAQSVSVTSNPVTAPPKVEKRGFFSHINPANLFKAIPKTNEPTPPPVMQVAVANPEPAPVTYSRYGYRSPRKPADGDRGAAEKSFAAGSKAQQAGQLSEAVQDYKQANQADPGYFDPYYNLGVVSTQAGNLAQALAAYETALAIQPDSHDARFNFALVLKRANYPMDAANELEKLLAKFPNDANAHYAVGTLYAQQLRQPARAREHYQKVLELNPAIPQAGAIHDWLWANPR
jgi:tetratricopeptide (TPR) repeat protein